MTELHNKLNNSHIIVPKEGQRCLLCSNKKLCRCPFLGYEQVEDDNKLNQAFDLLFDSLLKNDYANK